MGTLDIAKTLQVARERRGISQADAAKAIGCSYQAISNYERGINRVSADALYTLCNLYGIDMTTVLNSSPWEHCSLYEDFERAKTEAEKIYILEAYGPCPDLICEYQELINNRKPATNNGDGLSEAEAAMLKLFRMVPAESQGLVLGMIEAALKSRGL